MSTPETDASKLPEPNFPATALFEVPADEQEADKQISEVDAEIEADNG